MSKFFNTIWKVVWFISEVARILLNCLLVPASLIYSAISSSVDLGICGMGPRKLYILWLDHNIVLRASDSASEAAFHKHKLTESAPIVATVAIILVTPPVLLYGLILLFIRYFNGYRGGSDVSCDYSGESVGGSLDRRK